MSDTPFRAGAIAIIGRPNVGKSTLLNALVGTKLAITSRRPQTTRHTLRGIVTEAGAQFVFVDTPGFQTRYGGPLNQGLNRSVVRALADVDVVMAVLDRGLLGAADREVLVKISKTMPLVIVTNKLDLVERAALLPRLQAIAREFPRAEIVPVSAKQKSNLAELLATLRKFLPEQPALFAADELTDRDERFLAAELIREKLFRSLGEELPYGAGVEIDSFKEEAGLRRIRATIVVSKDNHKAMVVGKGGAKLKEIGSAARLDMERLFGGKVFLETWVKVREGWTEDRAALARFGLD